MLKIVFATLKQTRLRMSIPNMKLTKLDFVTQTIFVIPELWEVTSGSEINMSKSEL